MAKNKGKDASNKMAKKSKKADKLDMRPHVARERDKQLLMSAAPGR